MVVGSSFGVDRKMIYKHVLGAWFRDELRVPSAAHANKSRVDSKELQMQKELVSRPRSKNLDACCSR